MKLTEAEAKAFILGNPLPESVLAQAHREIDDPESEITRLSKRFAAAAGHFAAISLVDSVNRGIVDDRVSAVLDEVRRGLLPFGGIELGELQHRRAVTGAGVFRSVVGVAEGYVGTLAHGAAAGFGTGASARAGRGGRQACIRAGSGADRRGIRDGVGAG